MDFSKETFFPNIKDLSFLISIKYSKIKVIKLEIKNAMKIPDKITLLDKIKIANTANKIFKDCEDMSKNKMDFTSFLDIKKILNNVLNDSAIINKHENKRG